jgi:hypothetical protein
VIVFVSLLVIWGAGGRTGGGLGKGGSEAVLVAALRGIVRLTDMVVRRLVLDRIFKYNVRMIKREKRSVRVGRPIHGFRR